MWCVCSCDEGVWRSPGVWLGLWSEYSSRTACLCVRALHSSWQSKFSSPLNRPCVKMSHFQCNYYSNVYVCLFHYVSISLTYIRLSLFSLHTTATEGLTEDVLVRSVVTLSSVGCRRSDGERLLTRYSSKREREWDRKAWQTVQWYKEYSK